MLVARLWRHGRHGCRDVVIFWLQVHATIPPNCQATGSCLYAHCLASGNLLKVAKQGRFVLNMFMEGCYIMALSPNATRVLSFILSVIEKGEQLTAGKTNGNVFALVWELIALLQTVQGANFGAAYDEVKSLDATGRAELIAFVKTDFDLVNNSVEEAFEATLDCIQDGIAYSKKVQALIAKLSAL